MNKFNFYKGYWKGLDTLNPFQLRKVLKALSKYADTLEIPNNLSAKGWAVFNQIQRVIMIEIEQETKRLKRVEYGRKGAKKRWQ